MSRVPAWLLFLFGAIAVVAGVLGVGHAPAGVPKVFWAVITVVGAGSLALGWVRVAPATGASRRDPSDRPGQAKARASAPGSVTAGMWPQSRRTICGAVGRRAAISSCWATGTARSRSLIT